MYVSPALIDTDLLIYPRYQGNKPRIESNDWKPVIDDGL
jgi:hypothetical protein